MKSGDLWWWNQCLLITKSTLVSFSLVMLLAYFVHFGLSLLGLLFVVETLIESFDAENKIYLLRKEISKG